MNTFFVIAASESAIYLTASWLFRRARHPSYDQMPSAHRRWHAVLGVDTDAGTVTASSRKVPS
ncbi:hypothetical protein [Nocardia sp. NPDC004711]